MRPEPATAFKEMPASQPPVPFGRDTSSQDTFGQDSLGQHIATSSQGMCSADHAISVEIATPDRFIAMEREWRDLTSRALEPNIFMEPSLVAAAARSDDAVIHVLLVWGRTRPATPLCLVGVWAFACRRPSSRLPLTVLKSPVHDHAYLGIPVLDADRGADALTAMLDAIAREPSFPKMLEVGSFDADGPVAALLADALASRGSQHLRLEPRLRPRLRLGDSGAEAAPLSASRAKALRRRRKHLDKQGPVTLTRHRDPEGVRTALEEFLILEASGWKGRASQRGRAILRIPSLDSFFRSAVAGLAARGQLEISALRSDGRPVAMQMTVRSGATAFTWKSAYDEALKDCSPGIILLQEVTASLLSEPGLRSVDSCSHSDESYMAEFWSGRKPVLDLVMDVRRGTTAAFLLLSSAEHVRRQLQFEARRMRRVLQSAQRTASSACSSILSACARQVHGIAAKVMQLRRGSASPHAPGEEVVRSAAVDRREGGRGR
ncbi:Acetyltransferase (GNAT) domain-containing protein [Bosea lathyri]|uniref:Acetyltransferase (GNAT) domain-containing protein n=2 Tax=Bosea lathyri TaxID=1036778 RepID=A0A1H5S1Q8_9HYPH|nr:Acetyltransferase (GNAT) domain-containing protein [Bosea lathyri]